MISPPPGRSGRLAFSAAGFIATRTSGASPGVMMAWSAKCSWKELTPGRVPVGARISAGKFGSVERSLPKDAVSLVNRLPVSCMPSPESPARRMTTRSSSTTLFTSPPGADVGAASGRSIAVMSGLPPPANVTWLCPQAGCATGHLPPWQERTTYGVSYRWVTGCQLTGERGPARHRWTRRAALEQRTQDRPAAGADGRAHPDRRRADRRAERSAHRARDRAGRQRFRVLQLRQAGAPGHASLSG